MNRRLIRDGPDTFRRDAPTRSRLVSQAVSAERERAKVYFAQVTTLPDLSTAIWSMILVRELL